MLKNIKFQIKNAWLFELLFLLICFFSISLVVTLHLTQDVAIGDLVRDLNATAKLPFYTGFLSQLGIFFWAATTAICFFTAMLLAEPQVKEFKSFFICSGLLVLIMALDDAFLLHEKAFPKIGISEKTLISFYAFFLFYILKRFCSIIAATEFIFLATALFFFAVSVVTDFFQYQYFWNQNQYRILLEDGAKFTGIVAWLVYYFRAGIYAVSLISVRPSD